MAENRIQASNSEQEAQSMRSMLSKRRLILVMAGVMLGMLLSALDQTIVGTAMPRVISELNGLEHYAWVFTSYMLASTVMVPIWGKLSDIYGRRAFFLGGMALFLLGSALSGTSQTMFQLILFRGIQGLGAGAMLPIVQAIVGDIFPPAERGKWQGVMMAVFGLASIIGPTAGGWITDNWGWRWVFYVNMPVGALAILTAGFAIPRGIFRRQHAIDYIGAAVLIAAAVPMLLAFSWAGTQYDWGSWEIVSLFVWSALMFAAFFLIENRAAEPIISPGLFKSSIFSVSVIASFLSSMGMFGAIMYLPLFVQGVIGDTATNSGAVLTPMMMGFVVSSIVGGQIMSRTGRYKIMALVSLAVATAGMFLLSRMGVGATDGLVARNMVITGLGLGVIMGMFTIVAQNAFPFNRLGEVTASLQFFRSIGGTIGVAILGTIMTTGFHTAFESNLPATLKAAIPPDKLQALENPEILLAPQALAKLQESFAAYGAAGQTMLKQLMSTMQSSLATAISNDFTVGALVMVLATLSCLFLREIPLRKTHVEEVQVYGDRADGNGSLARSTRGTPNKGVLTIALLSVLSIALIAMLGISHGTVVAQIGWPNGQQPSASVQWTTGTENSPAAAAITDTVAQQTEAMAAGTPAAQPAPAESLQQAGVAGSQSNPAPAPSAQPSPAAADQAPSVGVVDQRQSPAPGDQVATPAQTDQAPPSPAPVTPAVAPSPAANPTANQTTYVVQPGDTLSRIAAQFYGSASSWPRIVSANQDKIASPNLIQPGTALVIPQP